MQMCFTVFTEKINMIMAAVTAVFAYFFGDFRYFFLAFLLLNIADYFTGWAKARYTGKEDSAQGAMGIVRKVGYWIVIAIAFFVAVSCYDLGQIINVELDFLNVIGYFTLATYIVNEIRSILENLIVLGVQIPDVLIKGLSIAQETIEKNGE